MKIKETLKEISFTIAGMAFVVVIIGILSLIPKPVSIPLSALEAWPEAQKIAKEKYPDAQLIKAEAATGNIESYTSTYGETIETKTKWNSNPNLHDDGTADKWNFTFYSPSEKLIISVSVRKKKSEKIIGESSTEELQLPFEERHKIGQSKEELQEKNKEIQERWESWTFDPKNWKIDSTEVIDIIKSKMKGEFSISKLALGGQKDGTLTWVASSAKVEKTPGGKWWKWETVARVDAVSGEILELTK